ncbi:MAG: hypothetical protein SNG69_04915 [Rikenellaceae bacterium]
MKRYYLFILLLSLFLGCSDDNIVNKDSIEDIVDKEVIVSPNKFSSSFIVIDDIPQVYPMQVLKRSDIEKGHFNDLGVEIYPYSLIFDFTPVPYIVNLNTTSNMLSFTKAISEAMSSNEWQTFNDSGTFRLQYLAYAMFSSIDKAKDFLGDASLYRLLESEDYKYTFIAKILSSKFSVNTYFEDEDIGENVNDKCYVSSVVFGRYAYLSIQSNDNPKQIYDMFVNGILNNDTSYISDYIDISSSVNVIEKGSSVNNSYLGADGFHRLINTFSLNQNYTGVPIMFELKDLKTKEPIVL